MDRKKLIVRVDLYGEGDSYDMWEGVVYDLTHEDFMEIRKEYEHDGSNDIRVTWSEFLDEKGVTREPLRFDVDEYN